MNYKLFCNYLDAIRNGVNAIDNGATSRDKSGFERHARWSLESLERVFDDRNKNIRRFLEKKPGIFKSDRTGEMIEIPLGKDTEALYGFLLFCKRINNGCEIDEDFRDYLALLITKSNSEEWEEC